jgi:hypothetical protein
MDLTCFLAHMRRFFTVANTSYFLIPYSQDRGIPSVEGITANIKNFI